MIQMPLLKKLSSIVLFWKTTLHISIEEQIELEDLNSSVLPAA
jgi:hypothetical protein